MAVGCGVFLGCVVEGVVIGIILLGVLLWLVLLLPSEEP